LLSAKQVAPGQSGDIEVSVRTEGLTGINKVVHVTTNDPRQQIIGLTLLGTVEPEFALSERNIYFGSNPRGKAVVKELTITVHPQRDSKILSAQTDDANVTVAFTPVAGSNDKSYKLVATQKADAKDGYHFGTVLLKTTSKQFPEVRVSVRGMVTAP
jgi:hypothetical protein